MRSEIHIMFSAMATSIQWFPNSTRIRSHLLLPNSSVPASIAITSPESIKIGQ